MVQAILWSWRAKEMEIRWRSGGTNGVAFITFIDCLIFRMIVFPLAV